MLDKYKGVYFQKQPQGLLRKHQNHLKVRIKLRNPQYHYDVVVLGYLPKILEAVETQKVNRVIKLFVDDTTKYRISQT